MNRKLFGLLFILTTLTLRAEDTLKQPYFSIKMLENPEDVKVSESVYKLLSVTDPEALSENEREKFAVLKNAYLKHEKRKQSWLPRRKTVVRVIGDVNIFFKLLPIVDYLYPLDCLKTQEDVELKKKAEDVASEESFGKHEAISELQQGVKDQNQRDLGWWPDRKSVAICMIVQGIAYYYSWKIVKKAHR